MSPATAGRQRFFGVFPSIVLPMFLAIIDGTIVAAALPAIAGALGGVERLSWVVVAYLVATTIAAPVYGRLGDVLGRRRLMFVALAIYVSGSLLCALSQSLEMLAAARVLQGVGGGGLMTLSQALIGEAIPPRERARFQGYLAAVAVSASAFGPVAGGFLTEHFGWRSIFLVNLPGGMAAALLALRLPRRSGTGEAFRFDFGGLVLFAAFIATTLVMLEMAQVARAGAWVLSAALATVAVAALVLLIRRERRVQWPLLPLPLLRHPAIWRCGVLAACHGAALVSLITFLPLYFRMVHGVSAAGIGVLLLPLTIGIGFGSLVTGRIVSRTGHSAILPSVGLSLGCLLVAGMAVVASHLGAGATSVAFGFVSIFMGTVMGVVQVTVQLAAGSERLGAGAAMVQFSRSLGAALGTALVGSIVTITVAASSPAAGEALAVVLQQGPEALEHFSPAAESAVRSGLDRAFRNAFLCAALFVGIGACTAWTLPVRRV